MEAPFYLADFPSAIYPVWLSDGCLFIIDQRLLPGLEKHIELSGKEDVYDAIKTLAVRGAPAIGVAAAYGLYISVKAEAGDKDIDSVRKLIESIADYLAQSRPTAFNLFYALNRMKKAADRDYDSSSSLIKALEMEAIAIHREDLDRSLRMGQAGLSIVPKGANILTHCNAGALATGGLGTALSVIYAAHDAGRGIHVYVDETRPLLQGARLTAWELNKAKIPYTVNCDNMAGFLMKQGKVDMVVLGADRIAMNGDFANKIGTYSLAVLCKYHGVPFYTAAPVSTFDPEAMNGDDIPVEQRRGEEVLGFRECRTTPDGSTAYNPSFDVTPHELLSGIITEYGVLVPPFGDKIKEVIDKNHDE